MRIKLVSSYIPIQLPLLQGGGVLISTTKEDCKHIKAIVTPYLGALTVGGD